MTRMLTVLIFLGISQLLLGQAYNDCEVAAANPVCDILELDGYTANSGGYTADHGPELDGFCNGSGTIENNGWVSFVASGPTLEIQVNYSNCTGSTNPAGLGLQAAIVSTPDCTNYTTLSCYFQPTTAANDSFQMIANNLVIGQTYFLMLDGYAGSICDFSVQVLQGGGSPPVGEGAGTLSGTNQLCPGSTGIYTFGPVTGAYFSTWELPPGATINGENPATVVLDGYTQTTVYIDFDATASSGPICVTPYNACNLGNPVCTNVIVSDFLPQELPPDTVCHGESFVWIDGNTYTGSYGYGWGAPELTYAAGLHYGTQCDSVITQRIFELPEYSSSESITICEGEPYQFGNQQITSSGTYTETLTTAQGCDSTVFLTVSVIDVLATSNGPLSINCSSSSSNLLDGSGSSTGAMISYEWYNPNDSLLSDQLIANTTFNGQHYFVVTNTENGFTCKDTAYTNVVADFSLPQNVAATGGTIGCGINASTTLVGTTSTPGAILQWSGPGGPYSTGGTITATQTGTYIFSVTHPFSHCTESISVDVLPDASIPDLTASGGEINCSNPSVLITSNSTTGGVTYAWTGPGGFTSANASETVSNPGAYQVIVTDNANGCTNSTSIMVLDSTTAPIVNAIGNTIDCNNPQAQLTATATNASSYSWAGPSGYTSSLQSPNNITIPGAYTVTVTNNKGCTGTASATVTSNTVIPDLSTSGATLTCQNSNVMVSGSSSTTGVTFNWSGPNGFTINAPTFFTSDAGTYLVTVTDPLNGCTTAGSALVNENTVPPVITAIGSQDILTCTITSTQLNLTTSGNIYAWGGPSGYSSADQNPTVSTAGDYYVTVTGNNGCTTIATTTVFEDANPPDILVANGLIDCANPTTQLSATSTSTINLYQWSGPNGFTANTQMATVSEEGMYSVTVTGNNGCTSEDMAIVTLDDVLPGATAQGGTLNCTTSSIDLLGNSTTLGASANWFENGTLIQPGFPFSATNPGTYTMVVTGTNGCTNEVSVVVDEDIVEPGATATANEDLTCTDPVVSIEGSSLEPTATFNWTGPNGYASSTQNPNDITDPGQYILVVTNPNNGCTSTDQANVLLDAVLPDLTATGGVLTCDNPVLTLVGSSTTSGITYLWSGPDINGDPTLSTQDVGVGGAYQLQVMAPNGCAHDTTVMVVENFAPPLNVTATGGIILCGTTSLTLQANSSTPGATYQWQGPGGNLYNEQNPMVDEPGTYTLTVTNPLTGCTTTETAEVLEDQNAPNADIAITGEITCINPSVTLTASSTTAGVSYTWTGPGGSTLNGPTQTVVVLGDYKLEVTAPNGCITVRNIALPVDTISPGASTSNIDLSCAIPNGTLYGNTNTSAAVTYSWTGPSGYTSTVQNPNDISLPGDYTLVVTNQTNGCVSTATASVSSNVAPPDAFANDAILDCHTPMLQLNAGSLTANAAYSWTGPNGFQASVPDPEVNQAGTYVLTVQGPNGCTSQATAIVTENMTPPTAIITVNQVITCAMPEIMIQGQSDDLNATFSWTGPNGFTSTAQNPMVNAVGTYTLMTTGQNGCTGTASEIVDKDVQVPDLFTEVDGIISCLLTTVEINATSNQGLTYVWTGPGGFTGTNANQMVSTPGLYEVIGTADNGCQVTGAITVLDDTTPPISDAQGGFTIDCSTEDGHLSIGESTTGSHITYEWTTLQGQIVQGSTSEMPEVNAAGIYSLLVTNTENGCTATSDTEVDIDDNTPQDAELYIQHISCYGGQDGMVMIEDVIGGTPPYLITFGDGKIGHNKIYNQLAAGDYPIEIIDANGCHLMTGASIVEPELQVVDLGPDQFVEFGTEVEIVAHFSNPKKVEYLDWNTMADTTCVDKSQCNIQRFVALETMTFEVAVMDTSGCEATDRVNIYVNKPRNVFFPNVFSPDGNGQNDFYQFYTGDGVEKVHYFRIFDRWGNMVYEVTDLMDGTSIPGWDGRLQGKKMDPGVFVYRASIQFLDGESETFQGDITLLR